MSQAAPEGFCAHHSPPSPCPFALLPPRHHGAKDRQPGSCPPLSGFRCATTPGEPTLLPVPAAHGILPHPAVPGPGLRRCADPLRPRHLGARASRLPPRPALGVGAAGAAGPLCSSAGSCRLLGAGAGGRGAGAGSHLAPGPLLQHLLRAPGAEHRPLRHPRQLPAGARLLLLGGGGRGVRGGHGGRGTTAGSVRERGGPGAEANVGQQGLPGPGHLQSALRGGAALCAGAGVRGGGPLHLHGAGGGPAALRGPGLQEGGCLQPLAARQPPLLPDLPLPLQPARPHRSPTALGNCHGTPTPACEALPRHACPQPWHVRHRRGTPDAGPGTVGTTAASPAREAPLRHT